jgi:hypothetical protein
MAYPFDPKPVLRERDLADRWRKSLRTVQRMRDGNGGPAWFRIGRTVYYRLDDVLAFEAARLQGAEDRA